MYYSPNKLVCRLRHHYHVARTAQIVAVGRKTECQIYRGQHALITDPQFTLNRSFSQLGSSTKKRSHAIGNGREGSNVLTSTNRNFKHSSASKPPALQRKDIDERSHKIKHKGKPQSPKITEEQSFVLDLVKSGKSVFLTGSAGTGKSFTLREIIRACRSGARYKLGVTASTGMASVNIGGSTLHQWAGIGLGKESADVLVEKIIGKDNMQLLKEGAKVNDLRAIPHSAFARWRKVRTLVIDEISMVDGALFDKLEYIARVLRDNDYPFGGIQLVLSGDFHQLPPVPDQYDESRQDVAFAFEAESWSRCIDQTVILQDVFRQSDQAFVTMLNELRSGNVTEETTMKFSQLSRPVNYRDGIEPTDLFATRAEVDNANNFRLDSLPGDAYGYQATDIPGADENGKTISLDEATRLLKNVVVPESITLKVGAQVMLVQNIVRGRLVNGSVGLIERFDKCLDASNSGIPIAAAGVLYTCKQPLPDDIRLNDDLWPAVRFTNGDVLLCTPGEFEAFNADGAVAAARHQVPLILAWALSIHKSQGQTIERVRVDLRRIFEKGQAYVALSRATSMETLQVIGFDPAKVVAHLRVIQYMSQFTENEQEPDEDEIEA